MKCFKLFFPIFSLLFLFSCDSTFLKQNEFKSEFKNHNLNPDSILFDGDQLHPTYAFIKKGKITGLELNANPECGNIITRYFLNNNEEIEKIVVEKYFYSEHCGKPFDSIYVIEPTTKKIKVFTKSTNGKEIINESLFEKYKIDINSYRKRLKIGTTAKKSRPVQVVNVCHSGINLFLNICREQVCI